MEKDELLSFKEFIGGDIETACYNTRTFFLQGVFGDQARKSLAYKKYKNNFPEENKELVEKTNKIRGFDADKYKKDLYEFYKIMNGYGASNKDLFIYLD